ncbi:MAG: glucosaminidase domain-containing protein [Bacteroidales bacterium]|jgi:LysM repeat protein|nr:glucosaminidase domain-containing protein [Bacteroidales bacterium]
MKNIALYTFLAFILLLASCSSSRRAARSSEPLGPARDYAIDYLSKYGSLAVSEMKRTGIPASITLAQGMLESNYGRSRLATQGNNHFGIKCHSSWTGRKIYHDDNRRGECFRVYSSAEESYIDHSEFLVSGSRYRDLFRLSPTDYKGWAHGLKKAGYATDPKYPELLIRKIEEYRLWAYDTGEAVSAGVRQPDSGSPPVTGGSEAAKTAATSAPSQPSPARTVPSRETEEPIKVIRLDTGKKTLENNNVEYIIVEEGDTYESLADRHQLLSWEITRYNDLPSGSVLSPGQVIYLQPKRSKAAQGFSVHVAEAGETMYSISQKYAVRLSSLYKMNLMDEGTECRPGQKLRIR